ncbi:hypothetical protein [Bacteroides sp.]|uniref:hypothetical protein n=1 Tax=Bacteroides sp. TaxID=29523 RepID=UPI0025C5292F|nr:hypothetical protein [Bacteroides sp.]
MLEREVEPTELLSIVETDKFINSISHFKGQEPDYKEIIRFSDKTFLTTILCNTILDWEIPYMMFLSRSLDCGLMKIPSLSCLNFNFNDEHAGIIIFTRIDGEDRILLDYYEEHSEQMLEINIYKKKILAESQ